MVTNIGQVMTLANSIIGVSILAMPYCFKQCGIVLSVLLLGLSSVLSRFACHFLLKAAIITRRRNYEFLAFHVFGSTGKLGVELAIIGFLLGTCIAFFVVMGDLGPAIISSMLGLHKTDTLRTSILVGMALFVVLPLGLLRNVDSLSSLCTATFVFYVCLVLKVMGEAAGPLVSGDWLNQVVFWRPEGILQCSPIFSMALFCQTQLFEIFDTVPNVALDKLNAVVRVAINLCTAVYISVGFFGYVAFSKENITGNILVSLSQTMSSEVIKVGFVLSVAVSFPLVIFPCRASLYSLLYRSAQPPVHDIVASNVPEGRFKTLTIGIVGISLVVGLLLPNIERVLGIVGSTIGVTICIITPSLLLGNTARHSKDRLVSQVIMWLGAIIMILGTYAHILHSGNAVQVDPTSNHGNDFILDHTAGRLIEQQHLPVLLGDQNVKKLVETSEEKAKVERIEFLSEKSKSSKQSSEKKYPSQKNSEVDPVLLNVKENKVKPNDDSEVKSKPVKIDEKLQEPPIPADAEEKQQEPPVPVEVVVKQASAEPVIAVMPAPVPSSESTVSKSKPGKVETKIQEQSNAEKSKVASISNAAEEVNQDAIRHEDAESALEAKGEKEKGNIVEKPKKNEFEDQKKKAEEQKLMDTLKEHQEVQRDILNEQQKILQEMKKHEHVQQKTNNEVVKDTHNKLEVDKKDIEIRPLAKMEANKIQFPKEVLEKKELPVLKKANISIVSSEKVQPPATFEKGKAAVPYPLGPKFGKAGSGPRIPLPLAYSAKLSSSPPPQSVDSKPAARDILESGVHQSEREKRDVSGINAEGEQGAGNGPIDAEPKHFGEVQNAVEGDSAKQCTQKEKDYLSQQLKNKASISSIPSLTKNDVVLGPELQKLETIDSRGALKRLVQSSPKSDSAVELKTPSSLSEPHVEIRANLIETKKYSGNALPIHLSDNMKPLQTKEVK